jgi:hypothetical protein
MLEGLKRLTYVICKKGFDRGLRREASSLILVSLVMCRSFPPETIVYVIKACKRRTLFRSKKEP